MGEAERRAPRSLIVGGILLLVLFAIGTFRPRAPDFDLTYGFEGYSHLGAPVFLVAAAIVLSLLAFPTAARRLGDLISRLSGGLPRPLRMPALLAGFGAAFWFLPNHVMSGDAGSVLYRLARGDVYPSNALTNYLFHALRSGLGLDLVDTVRLTSCLAGLVYVWCATAIGRECAPEGPRRAGITTLLLTTGTVALFFGTIEVYAPLVAGIAAYLLFGIRWLSGKGRGIAPAACLGIIFCLHGSAGLLLPSLIVLVNGGRILPLPLRSFSWWRSTILRTAPFLLVVAAMFLVLFYGEWGGRLPRAGADRYGTFLGAENEGMLLPLTLSPHDPLQRYAVLDVEHLVAVANLLLLVAPVGLLLFLAGRRAFEEARFRFVAIATLFLFLFPNFWNISYSMRRDWDLFSSLGIPLALLGGLAWFGRERSRADVVRVAALSIFCTLPFVVSNVTRERERYQYALVASHEIAAALAPAAAGDAIRVAEQRAMEAGLTPPGDDPHEFWRNAGGIVQGILSESRAMERTKVTLDLDRFRQELFRVAQGPEGGFDPKTDLELLVDATATELEAEVDRIGGSLMVAPSPGILAFSTCERVLRESQLPQIMGGPPYDRDAFELDLLDALDVAMGERGGFKYRREPFDESRWRGEITWRLKALGVRKSWSLESARWADLLTRSISEVLDPEVAGGRDLRWPVVDASVRRWARAAEEVHGPGYDRAFARASWVWTELKDFHRIDRYSRHWLARAPDHHDWLNLRFVVLHRQGRTEEGLELVRRAIRADPENLRLRLNLAEVLRDLGRPEEALRQVTTGLRLGGWHSRRVWGLLLLGELRIVRGEHDVAHSVLREALSQLERVAPSKENEDLRERVGRLLELTAR